MFLYTIIKVAWISSLSLSPLWYLIIQICLFHPNYILITNHGHSFCTWRCDSKISMNFLIFLHNFTNRRFSLTIDLSNFPIWFFLLSLLLTSLELLPFHLKELYFTLGLLGGSGSKESACNIGHPGLTPGSDRLPGEGKGNQLQYSCLENSLDRGSWRL